MSLITMDSERGELRRVMRDFLETRSPEREVRRVMETSCGWDETLWRQVCTELELTGLQVPTEFGGSGFGLAEVGVVLGEFGRYLACVPYFSTVILAQTTLLQADDEEAKQRWLPALADGTIRGTLAVTGPSGRWTDPTEGVTADQGRGGWRIRGTKRFVIDGHTADLILVAARGTDGASLFAVESGATGLHRTLMRGMDATRKLADLEFDDVSATLIGTAGSAGPVIDAVLDFARVGLATEQVGGADRAFEMAVHYAKTRIQFDRAIGSFQAIKHKCAEMCLQVEHARTLAYHALWAATEATQELPVAAAMAGALCSDAYFRIAAENIHIHGGIGFTWEHPAHLYFKRAKLSQQLFGSASFHRELLARRVGIQ